MLGFGAGFGVSNGPRKDGAIIIQDDASRRSQILLRAKAYTNANANTNPNANANANANANTNTNANANAKNQL